MVVIDMPLPDRCYDCPLSYWVQSGDYEGMMMCNAMEANLEANGLDRTGECLVDENATKRPHGCPMMAAILPDNNLCEEALQALVDTENETPCDMMACESDWCEENCGGKDSPDKDCWIHYLTGDWKNGK